MVKNLFGKSFSLVLIFSLTLLTVGPGIASAASKQNLEESTNESESLWLNDLKDSGYYSEQEIDEMVAEVEEIKGYFKKDNYDNIYFDADSARKNGVDEELILRTKEDMNKLKTDKKVSTLASCAGSMGYYPTQDIIFIDDCSTDDLTYWIGQGASVVTIAGLLTSLVNPPAGAAVGIAGVLINMGVSSIDHMNRGYGIAILLRGDDTRVVAQ
ncbi:hypothetical protein [Lentibacillus sp. Marseille-P4043]|uniref:hypothetical protein n=1 Tax=Lentibacillus sp. Marseille-P4043 TaxID=2040293 RepID=UPI000D0BD80A|nr:hypothetical protein [Lentibacillus sp. Marseille-P4043]